MGDLKSKLPDLKELGEIGGKLFKDLRTSVSEIIATYKQKHPSEEPSKPSAKKEGPVKKAKVTAEPKEKTKDKKET